MNNEIIKELLESKYDEESLLKFLSLVLAVRDFYQSLHWGTHGGSFYEDHLLFGEIYSKSSDESDELAEKFVGLSSESVVCPIKIAIQKANIYENLISDFEIGGSETSFYEHALFVENSFLNISSKLYDNLESSGLLTLGIDDLLSKIYSSHEENIYFMKQKIKNTSN